MSRYKAADLSGVHRFPFAERRTKVDAGMMGRVDLDSDSFAAFFDGLPDVLAARDLKRLARHTAEVIAAGGPVILMMGAHLIKTGVSPVLVELIGRGAVSCLAMNGAGAIHDLELAWFGRTSEDVAETLEDGRFGFVEETARVLNAAVSEGDRQGQGYGEAVARALERLDLRHPELSVVLAAWRHGVPVTVHSAPGTETIHQHPEADGAAIGRATLLDFRILCEQLKGLEGGVVFLYGSAVILPEVFLKALTVVRNLGHPVRRFTAVNFDMIRHYRPQANVVSRPTRTGGDGFTVIGHHELLIPLFWQAVYTELRRREG